MGKNKEYWEIVEGLANKNTTEGGGLDLLEVMWAIQLYRDGDLVLPRADTKDSTGKVGDEVADVSGWQQVGQFLLGLLGGESGTSGQEMAPAGD